MDAYLWWFSGFVSWISSRIGVCSEQRRSRCWNSRIFRVLLSSTIAHLHKLNVWHLRWNKESTVYRLTMHVFFRVFQEALSFFFLTTLIGYESIRTMKQKRRTGKIDRRSFQVACGPKNAHAPAHCPLFCPLVPKTRGNPWPIIISLPVLTL